MCKAFPIFNATQTAKAWTNKILASKASPEDITEANKYIMSSIIINNIV
ncbi:hypothetical protein GCM10009410_03990 [Shewanella ulleungensis]|uniref:Uncharacterized protein n=1 Tax=Shewanella ulleungensis TaxID=2282699 RepID=A0ABQ2QD36_9GAMM|nr:hypothetical protein GCM10009410_03990 [Shewanella ulleungensis]